MAEESNLAEAAESMAANLEASLGGGGEPAAPGGGSMGAGGSDGGGGSKPKMGEETKRERNLDLILDIPLRVTVELGRTKMVVRELLTLGQGSVIELNKLAGEPMEILVNDKLVAKGEAVVVNEKFGVRLTDIISPLERVEQLK
jgi:flagellar motor switch protein FliN/FliY